MSRSPEQNTRMSPSGPSRINSTTASQMPSIRSRSVALFDHRTPAHLDRVGASGHLDDRGTAEVFTESSGVDGGRGDDHLQVRTARQQLLEVPEQKVDVQAALVGLVDDQGVVAAQVAIVGDFGEQDAVRHHLDLRLPAGPRGEPDLIADHLAERGADLLRDPLRQAAGRDPSRLGVTDPLTSGPPRQSFGNWVVFPDPVSPATISTWWFRMASMMSSAQAEIGRAASTASFRPSPDIALHPMPPVPRPPNYRAPAELTPQWRADGS